MNAAIVVILLILIVAGVYLYYPEIQNFIASILNPGPAAQEKSTLVVGVKDAPRNT